MLQGFTGVPTATAMTAGSDGQPKSVDGGDPIILNGTIALCGRSDNNTLRGFNGRLAQLSLFNASLTNSSVAALFNQVCLLC